MHTTYCVSLSTSFEAFTELSAATVGSGLPHALAEAEGALPRRQALCRGEGYKSLEGTGYKSLEGIWKRAEAKGVSPLKAQVDKLINNRRGSDTC